jgi:hypothetical protein
MAYHNRRLIFTMVKTMMQKTVIDQYLHEIACQSRYLKGETLPKHRPLEFIFTLDRHINEMNLW